MGLRHRPDQQLRIDPGGKQIHTPVEMGPSNTSCGTDLRDRVALFDGLTLLDEDLT